MRHEKPNIFEERIMVDTCAPGMAAIFAADLERYGFKWAGGKTPSVVACPTEDPLYIFINDDEGKTLTKTSVLESVYKPYYTLTMEEVYEQLKKVGKSIEVAGVTLSYNGDKITCSEKSFPPIKRDALRQFLDVSCRDTTFNGNRVRFTIKVGCKDFSSEDIDRIREWERGL